MEELMKVIRKRFIWVEYGEFQGFREDISLSDLLLLENFVKIAISGKLIEEERNEHHLPRL